MPDLELRPDNYVQIDLDPSEYRDTRTRREKFVSSRLFMWLANLCGIWAALVMFNMRNWFTPETGWWILPSAFAPAAMMLLVWFAIGGEERHD